MFRLNSLDVWNDWLFGTKLASTHKRRQQDRKIFNEPDEMTHDFLIWNNNSSTQSANDVDRARGSIAFGSINHMTPNTGSQVNMQTAENNFSLEMWC